MKKIITSIVTICIVFNSFILSVSAATKAEGYAIYRDGAGINFDWHAGFIYNALYHSANTVIHVDNGANGNSDSTDFLINDVSLSEFINNQQFYGYYIPNSFSLLSDNEIASIKNNVIITINKLKQINKDDLKYNVAFQIWYNNDRDQDGKVDTDEITSMRCDGLIEYCYESLGYMIFSGDISTFDTSIRNAHSGTNITPKKQSTLHMHNCLGDIDYNCSVTATDGRLAMRIVSGIESYDKYQEFVLDVNGDEILNAADSRLILQYSSNIIDIFPADPLVAE